MEETLFRLIIIGDSSVGKSCLLYKFTENKFTENHEATIGVELGNKIIFLHDEQIKFQIWDTSGQENYRSVTRSFYRRADCALLVFDLTYYESFENCIHWLEEIRGNTKNDIPVYLIGNKLDLFGDTDGTSLRNEAEHFAMKYLLAGYFETSAKNGKNIDEMFKNIAQKLKSIEKVVGPTDSGNFEIQIVNAGSGRKKKCC